MTVLIFSYWFVCYSIMLMTVVLSIGRSVGLADRSAAPLRPWRWRWDMVESSHSLLVLSFLLVMVGATLALIMTLLFNSDPGTIHRLQHLFGLLSVSGICLGSYAVPAFALALTEAQKRSELGAWSATSIPGRLYKILGLVAWLLWLLCLLFWATRWGGLVSFVIHIYFALIIAATSIGGGMLSWKSRKLARPPASRFWNRVSSTASLLTVLYLPLFFLIDLSPGTGMANLPLIRAGFRFFPVFFVSWDLVYLANLWVYKSQSHGSAILPPDIAGAERPTGVSQEPIALSPELMQQYGLSERERQTACLLCGGRSYKEIASEQNLSVATVKTYVIRLYAKVGVNSKIELINKLRQS